MPKGVTIAVDAMGGDNAPEVVLAGVKDALAKHSDISVILCGPGDIVVPFCKTQDRCEPCVATEVIAMGEHPAQAVRKKKDSSIVVACKQVAQGKADGFFSAGSTGACLAAATLFIGRIKGVLRPMLVTIVPSPAKPVVLCDVGANADCKAEYLVQFARMGEVYSRAILGVQNPSVSLLNIGSEDAKGSQFAQESFAALKEQVPSFVGNAEPGDVTSGKFDVVVTDGFTGNICLKTIEGTSKVLFKSIKSAMLSSFATKIGALLIKKPIKALAASMSADTYGGAPLIGVKSACIIGHGSSSPLAIQNGITQTARMAQHQVSQAIADIIAPEDAGKR